MYGRLWVIFLILLSTQSHSTETEIKEPSCLKLVYGAVEMCNGGAWKKISIESLEHELRKYELPLPHESDIATAIVRGTHIVSYSFIPISVLPPLSMSATVAIRHQENQWFVTILDRKEQLSVTLLLIILLSISGILSGHQQRSVEQYPVSLGISFAFAIIFITGMLKLLSGIVGILGFCILFLSSIIYLLKRYKILRDGLLGAFSVGVTMITLIFVGPTKLEALLLVYAVTIVSEHLIPPIRLILRMCEH